MTFGNSITCVICGCALHCGGGGNNTLLFHDDEVGEIIPNYGDTPNQISREELEWLEDFFLVGQLAFKDDAADTPQTTNRRAICLKPTLSVARGTLEDDDHYEQAKLANGQTFDEPDLNLPAPRGSGVYSVHALCITMLREVGQQRPRWKSRPRTIEDFYQSICEKQTRDGSRYIKFRHNYYGAGRMFGQGWLEPYPGTQWMGANPMEIKDLTTYILSKLEAKVSLIQDPLPLNLGQSSQPNEAERTNLTNLPLEILRHVILYLPVDATWPFRLSSRRFFNATAHQTFWRDTFSSKCLVGYLWDLDPSLCQKHDPSGQKYDWKLLAQRLLVRNAFDLGKEFDDAPMALRNRQRIWKIVVDIGVKDDGHDHEEEYGPGRMPKAYLLPAFEHYEEEQLWRYG